MTFIVHWDRCDTDFRRVQKRPRSDMRSSNSILAIAVGFCDTFGFEVIFGLLLSETSSQRSGHDWNKFFGQLLPRLDWKISCPLPWLFIDMIARRLLLGTDAGVIGLVLWLRFGRSCNDIQIICSNCSGRWRKSLKSCGWIPNLIS
jgi:hypothetical protein